MFQNFLPKRTKSILFLALCAVILLLIIVGSIWYFHKPKQPVAAQVISPLSSAQFQQQVMTLVNLMKTQSSQAAFAYTEKEIQANPSFAKSCHPVLHELGHAAYTYYGGYAQAMQHSNEICDSGYVHGVLESYLGSDVNIQQALQNACSPSMSTYDQWQCYHGLGHGVMLVSLGSVPKSLVLCNTLTGSFATDACINGVYMQHFVVTSHDGDIPKTNPTSLSDCTTQPVSDRGTCYDYAPSAYLTVYSGQYQSAIQWCSGAGSLVSACDEGIGSQAMKDNITNVNEVKNICEGSTKLFAESCISGAVGMDVYFLGAIKQAETMCQNQFKAYESVCNGTIGVDKVALGL